MRRAFRVSTPARLSGRSRLVYGCSLSELSGYSTLATLTQRFTNYYVISFLLFPPLSESPPVYSYFLVISLVLSKRILTVTLSARQEFPRSQVAQGRSFRRTHPHLGDTSPNSVAPLKSTLNVSRTAALGNARQK